MSDLLRSFKISRVQAIAYAPMPPAALLDAARGVSPDTDQQPEQAYMASAVMLHAVLGALTLCCWLSAVCRSVGPLDMLPICFLSRICLGFATFCELAARGRCSAA